MVADRPSAFASQGNPVPAKAKSTAPVGVLDASWWAASGYDPRLQAHARGGMLQSGGARSGTPPRPALDEAPSSLRVADAIPRSLKTGKSVALPG